MVELPDYPWDALASLRARAEQHPDGVVDLSIGSPVDPTPRAVQSALAAATDAHGYPATAGSTPLRAAMTAWWRTRRLAGAVSPDGVMPTLGSKEFVAWLPTLLGLGPADLVVHPEAAYPTYAVGAALAGASALASDDPDRWPETTRLVWLNSPGNPDGRVLSIAELRAARSRARELGAILVSDECYAELGWEKPYADGPVPSLLDDRVTDGDLAGLLAAYSLSKQSNLAGYRAAFVAGDPVLIHRLVELRKHAGMMIAAPVQAAMIAALGDGAHVAEQKERYRCRRNQLRPALEAAGFQIERSTAGLYLWATEGKSSRESLDALADKGILAGPGEIYGDAWRNYVRFSLTATDERIAAAAQRLAG